MLLLGMCTGTIGAALPKLRDHFAVSDGAAAQSITVYNLGALVAIVGCAALTRRRTPPRAVATPMRVTTHSLILFALGTATMGLSPGFEVFLVGVAVAGSGYGSLVLHLNSTFAQGFTEHNVVMVNMINALFGTGAILGSLAIAPLGAKGVLASFAATAILAALTFPAVGTTRAIKAEPPTAARPGRRELAALAPFIMIALFYAGLETGTAGLESTYLTHVGHSDDYAAVGTALFWAGLTIGRVVIPPLARRTAPATLLAYISATAGLAALAALIPDAALIAFAVAGIAMGPIFPTTLAWLARSHPAAHTANSALLVASMIGSTTLPALVALLGQTTSTRVIPLAIATIGAAVFLTVLRRPSPAPRP
nr:MFS transporter [Streptomyces sp. SID3343]